MNNENLWGELPKVENIETPITLFKKQANLLTRLTEGLLEGTVVVVNGDLNKVEATMLITTPLLSGYKIAIVSVLHPLEMYPCNIINNTTGYSYRTKDEKEFIERLTEILQSEKVKKIVQSLLVQINAAK